MSRLYILILLVIIDRCIGVEQECYISEQDDYYIQQQQVIKSPLSKLSKDEIPVNYFWGNVSGRNYLTNIRNQHIPQYCGSCWAFSVSSMLSDRIKIQRDGEWPDIHISPQVLLSCVNESNGCSGGGTLSALRYIYTNNITDETCSPYQAKGHKNGLTCTPNIICNDCPNTKANCTQPNQYYVYGIQEYGRISGEEDILNEVYQRGPVACGIYSKNGVLSNYTSGILNVSSEQTGNKTTHVVNIVGFGVDENNTKYWIVRNSWGGYWGESGYFKIIRGTNNLLIENGCTWAVPKDTWTNKTKHIDTDRDIHRDIDTQKEKSCVVEDDKEQQEIIKSPLPYTYIDTVSLPEQYDWRNMSGINYLSWTQNQHLPQYCGSCWAQASTSALADRISIHIDKGIFPKRSLSVQAIINCKAGGTCKGGYPIYVYQYAYTHGIPEEYCQVYEAKDPVYTYDPVYIQDPVFTCRDIDICKNCRSPSPVKDDPEPQKNCFAVQNYTKWYVSEYGYIRGVTQMKAEIYARGPISCAIFATDSFHSYQAEHGIFQQQGQFDKSNHIVSVVGWGLDTNGTEYWIARNSWGTYWGDYGFFKIIMYRDNLGIEQNCQWAVPSTNPN